MSTIYLVRHGQASFGTDNYDQLSATGREQVRQLGKYFAESGERIDRIYAGALRRQTETAEIIAESLGGARRLPPRPRSTNTTATSSCIRLQSR